MIGICGIDEFDFVFVAGGCEISFLVDNCLVGDLDLFSDQVVFFRIGLEIHKYDMDGLSAFRSDCRIFTGRDSEVSAAGLGCHFIIGCGKGGAADRDAVEAEEGKSFGKCIIHVEDKVVHILLCVGNCGRYDEGNHISYCCGIRCYFRIVFLFDLLVSRHAGILCDHCHILDNAQEILGKGIAAGLIIHKGRGSVFDEVIAVTVYSSCIVRAVCGKSHLGGAQIFGNNGRCGIDGTGAICCTACGGECLEHFRHVSGTFAFVKLACKFRIRTCFQSSKESISVHAAAPFNVGEFFSCSIQIAREDLVSFIAVSNILICVGDRNGMISVSGKCRY